MRQQATLEGWVSDGWGDIPDYLESHLLVYHLLRTRPFVYHGIDFVIHKDFCIDGGFDPCKTEEECLKYHDTARYIKVTIIEETKDVQRNT